MDVLDAHLRSLSLKEYRDLIKTLKLRKELPKNYSKLAKSELYEVVKPLVKSVNDGDKIFINKNSNSLVEIKPREVKSRVKKTQEPPTESEKTPEIKPSKIPKAKVETVKAETGDMVEDKPPKRDNIKKTKRVAEVPCEASCEVPKTPRRSVKEAVAKIESKK